MDSTNFTPVPTTVPPSGNNPQNPPQYSTPQSGSNLSSLNNAPPPTYDEALMIPCEIVYQPPQPRGGAVSNIQPVMVPRFQQGWARGNNIGFSRQLRGNWDESPGQPRSNRDDSLWQPGVNQGGSPGVRKDRGKLSTSLVVVGVVFMFSLVWSVVNLN